MLFFCRIDHPRDDATTLIFAINAGRFEDEFNCPVDCATSPNLDVNNQVVSRVLHFPHRVRSFLRRMPMARSPQGIYDEFISFTPVVCNDRAFAKVFGTDTGYTGCRRVKRTGYLCEAHKHTHTCWVSTPALLMVGAIAAETASDACYNRGIPVSGENTTGLLN